MSDDIVKRLRDRGVCSTAQNSCRNDYACERAAAEIERLRALVGEVRDALAPFTAEAGCIMSHESDDEVVYDSFFTVGEFRRACAALAKADEVLK